MPHKAFLDRLYPSRTQERLLDATLETCRRFYNDCLVERKTAWEAEQRSVGKVEQLRRVKERKATNPWAKNVHSHVLQIVVTDLDKAFDAFFRRVKAGEDPGYPRFKGRNRWRSFGYKEYGNGFKLDGRRLKLSGIGRIAVRWHRLLEGQIKTLRISNKAGKWYASFSCVVEDTSRLEQAAIEEVGIDVGLSSLITTSDGEKTNHPRFYRAAQRQLRVAQRRVARRKKGGKNRRKAVVMLQRQHERIANQRKDYLNKLAHNLTTRYDRIALEDLTITRMVHGNLAKSILDAGWGYLVQRLRDKAASAGRVVVLVNPHNTSKTCSGCGGTFEGLTLADRWVSCACGLSLDRDHNAALNIKNRAGQARWGISSPLGELPQEAARF
jgi:putative transposase